jgi:hypothetical protein
MTLTRGAQVAQVYFTNGAIVHAELDALRGMDVLVELLDFTAGDFLFDAGITTTEQTIQTDLHRSVMMALKLRDERQQEKQRNARPAEEVSRDKLERFVSATATVRDVALLTSKGQLLAFAHREPEVESVNELREAIVGIFSHHPRAGLSRVVLEDEAGVLMGQSVEAGLLVLIFTPGTAVGIAVHAVGKLVTEVGRVVGAR